MIDLHTSRHVKISDHSYFGVAKPWFCEVKASSADREKEHYDPTGSGL
jgi:hypothetical protein